eukprot:scaffold666_cov332-Prasinococcus_capsulatus_cf.AAC.17
MITDPKPAEVRCNPSLRNAWWVHRRRTKAITQHQPTAPWGRERHQRRKAQQLTTGSVASIAAKSPTAPQARHPRGCSRPSALATPIRAGEFTTSTSRQHSASTPGQPTAGTYHGTRQGGGGVVEDELRCYYLAVLTNSGLVCASTSFIATMLVPQKKKGLTRLAPRSKPPKALPTSPSSATASPSRVLGTTTTSSSTAAAFSANVVLLTVDCDALVASSDSGKPPPLAQATTGRRLLRGRGLFAIVHRLC